MLGTGPGQRVELGDGTFTVVGLVENGGDLDDGFGLVAQLPGPPTAATVYLDTDSDTLARFTLPSGAAMVVGERGRSADAVATGAVLLASVILVVLVALVAVAAFFVVARRRLRHLGLLAAVGADRRHLGLVMTAHGALLGAAAVGAGTVLSLGAWLLVADRLEPLIGRRLDQTAVPWLAVTAWAMVTVAATSIAAAWPTRQLLRVPVVAALEGRPPESRPHTTFRPVRPLLLLAAGLAALWLASDPLRSTGALVLLLIGTALVIAAVVTCGPPLVALIGRLSGQASIAVRLAGRDLARYRHRSGAALAALTLIVGLAVATIGATTAATAGHDEGNLGSNQVMLRVGEVPGWDDVAPVPERTPAEIAELDQAAGRIADELDAPAPTPVDVALVPDEAVVGGEGLPVAVVTEDIGDGFGLVLDLVYVASEPLLSAAASTGWRPEPDSCRCEPRICGSSRYVPSPSIPNDSNPATAPCPAPSSPRPSCNGGVGGTQGPAG